MKRVVLSSVVAVILVLVGVTARAEVEKPPSYVAKHEQMLYPTVRVRSGGSAGSGTVVWSGKVGDGGVRTYIITNYHVIGGAVSIRSVWDPKRSRDVKKEFRETVTAEFFRYNNYSRNIGTEAVQADIVAYDEKGDIALIESRDYENKVPYVAIMFPKSQVESIHIYDQVFAVGAALGHAPISTMGLINFLDEEIDNYSYWMSSAQIIFGNSGGAIYRWSAKRSSYEWIGVPSRVAFVWGSGAVTHLGYFIPVTRVYDFLDSEKFRFIYDSSFSYTSEKGEREKIKEAKEQMLQRMIREMEGGSSSR